MEGVKENFEERRIDKRESIHQASNDIPSATIDIVTPTTDYGMYKWLVVIACFMCNVITGGIERSDGIFYIKFVDKFQGTAQATSWAIALAGALRLVLGPVSSALSNRFSSRLTVIVGGLILFLSFLVSGYATSLLYLYITFGVVGGIGRSFIYTPGLVVVGQYFANKPGLAVGISASGVGAGTFVFPLLVNLMFDEFNLWGGFLILSAVMLNSCAFGALFRPVHGGRKKQQMPKYQNRKHQLLFIFFGANKVRQQVAHIKCADKEMKDTNPVQLIHVNRGFTGSEHDIIKDEPELQDHDERYMSKCGKSCAAIQENKNQKAVKQRNAMYETVIEKSASLNGSKENNHDKRKLLDLSLLRNPSFVMFCISICLFTGAFRSAFTFFPALAKSRGCTEAEAAYLVSISGILDTLGRILAGFVLDLEKVRRYRPFVYSVVLLSISGASFACPFMFGFVQFVAISGVYGMLTGAYVSQKSVILVDILGVNKLTSSFGLLLLSQGLGSLLGPPLSGLMKDTFDDFGEAFFLGGGFMCGAAIIMVASNILLAVQRQNNSVIDS